MALLTQELLKKKLSSWMLSSKVVEHLGFEENQASEVKQELDALVEMGLVERDGQRRGLKFRFVSADNSNEDEQDSSDAGEIEDDSEASDTPSAKKIHDESASLRAFFADRDHIKSETNGKTPLQLMSVITDIAIKDPSILSHTLSYKRTSEGNIIVTFWSGCVKQYEKEYTLAAFSKVLISELKALSKPILVA
ncbi:MAG: hypothetical protein JHC33_04885 [Ignisphaera sp.]|nr:hypothetical protein [Ignisphaera sp.]